MNPKAGVISLTCFIPSK